MNDYADFSPKEYQQRLSKLRVLMAERGIDAVLVTTEANHRYFTGHVTHRWMHQYTAMFALLPLEGEPLLIVPPQEACMCEEDSWMQKHPNLPIRTYSPGCRCHYRRRARTRAGRRPHWYRTRRDSRAQDALRRFRPVAAKLAQC